MEAGWHRKVWMQRIQKRKSAVLLASKCGDLNKIEITGIEVQGEGRRDRIYCSFSCWVKIVSL